MKSVFEAISKIYSTPGRKDKGNIIAANKDNESFLKFLKFSMDDYYIYGVSEKSFEGILDKGEFYYDPKNIKDFLEAEEHCSTVLYNDKKMDYFLNTLIPYLFEKQSHSNEVVDKIADFFSEGLNKIERYFYYRCIIKNLSIGIGPKTINQVLGRILIEMYTPMLADQGIEKFDKWKLAESDNYYADTKINGLRLSLFIKKDASDIIIKTRANQRFNLLEEWMKKYFLTEPHVKSLIEEIPNAEKIKAQHYGLKYDVDYDYVVLDCELQHKDKTWESSISIINKNELEVYEGFETEPNFYLFIFDAVNDNPFKPENFEKESNSTLPYYIRREMVEYVNIGLTCKPTHGTKLFKATECEIINEFSEVEKTAQRYVEEGFEGAVIKHPNSTYVCGRPIHWLKIKDVQTYDGEIVEILPGEASGKYANVAGKIKVKTTIKGKEVVGTCGSGFKDKDREYLMENKDTVIGKMVEFTILGKSVNDNFTSGIFKGLRDDKKSNEV